MKRAITSLLVGLFMSVTLPVSAQDEPYVLTAAPRGTLAAETKTYQPLANFLAQVLHHPVVYKWSSDWLTYQDEMVHDRYDIIFDGPHFVSWRIQYLDHVPLVKLPQPHIWVIITRADNNQQKAVADLVGRTICSPAPPNFGTLTLQTFFANPMEQPFIVATKGWRNGYDGVVSKKCVAAIMPLTNWHKFNTGATSGLTKILFQHTPFPNQALTVSARRFSAQMQAKVREALLSPAGEQALMPLRARYAMVHGQMMNLVPATKEEYANVDEVLKGVRGFDEPPTTKVKRR